MLKKNSFMHEMVSFLLTAGDEENSLLNIGCFRRSQKNLVKISKLHINLVLRRSSFVNKNADAMFLKCLSRIF